MAQIVLDARKVKAYEGLKLLCDYTEKTEEWCNALWLSFLTDEALYEEFVYYLDHHGFADKMKIEGYSLSDIYVWQMEQYNLRCDSGKNTEACNKETMVLQAFWTMTEMKKNPEDYVKKLDKGFGMDKF